MDIDPPVPPSSAPKKLKFMPKAPRRRKTDPVLPKSDSGGDDAEADREFRNKVKERLGTRGRKVEKESSGNVTKSHGTRSSSTPLMTPEQPKDRKSKRNPDLTEAAEKCIMLSSSTATKGCNIDEMAVDGDGSESSSNTQEEYKEPWNHTSYYPTVLPWRLPGSGDPEILNAQEFWQGEEYEENNIDEYDEKNIDDASELGLGLGPLEMNDEKQKPKPSFLFQFPLKLPLGKQMHPVPTSSKGKEKVESSSSSNKDGLKGLPDGLVGKMLVYKSGAIKLKLGDKMFNVTSGISREFAEDVAMMDTKNKDCLVLGSIDKHAVVSPDLSILDDINQLDLG